MRIVMVGPFGLRPKGTMAARALPLARALASRGHTVHMVLPPWSNPEDSGRSFSDGGVAIINIALPPRLPVLFHLLVAWQLVRAALAQQPDVVHCFKPKAYSGLAAFVLWLGRSLRLARLRLVVDSDDWEGRGGWNERERYSRVQKAVFAWQEQWGLRHCDAVTVASRALQTLIWSLGAPPDKVVYLPNGADLAASAAEDPVAIRRSDRQQNILLYTRFFEFTVARVVTILSETLRQVTGAHVVVVGAGLFAEEREFLARMQEAGLAERVGFAGWREPAELASYFAAASVAVFPFDDTLINRAKCSAKLIDLLAAGVPVVADRVGQNAEYIEHGVSGILIDPGDTTAFTTALVRLLRDEGQQRRLGAAARQRIAQAYAWDLLANTLEDAYR